MAIVSSPSLESDKVAARHVLWVAEAALGRLRRAVVAGGLVDDDDGFIFLVEDARQLEQIVSELSATAAFGVAPVAGGRSRDLIEAVAQARREARAKLHRGPDRTPRMAAIATPVMVIPAATTGGEARQRFLDDETLSTLVYVDERNRPVGAIGREALFRMFSGQYGHAVFSSRPVLETAVTRPRLIDAETTIVEAANTVANRDADALFEDILVVDPGGRVTGLVRVRDLLRALTNLGPETFQQLNPLTGLPGPVRIEQALLEMLDVPEPLVVSRVDIVDFRTFNEQAGFTTGDRTIQTLGHVVAETARGRGVRFVGHIGGDDFIVAWNDESEAIVGTVEIAHGLLEAVEHLGRLAAGANEPELAVSTLVLRPGEIHDVDTLANRLAALKDEVRRHGGAFHAIARLETIADPAWRPLDSGYVSVAGDVAGMLGR